MPKKVQTTAQVSLFHMLAWLCSKSFKPGFNTTWPNTFRCTSWVSKKQRKQKSNCQYSLNHEESKGVSEKTSASLKTLKTLTVGITANGVDREHLPRELFLKNSVLSTRGTGILPMSSILKFCRAPFIPQ